MTVREVGAWMARVWDSIGDAHILTVAAVVFLAGLALYWVLWTLVMDAMYERRFRRRR